VETLEIELSGKAKLVFEAVEKIKQGQKMFEEGNLELKSLLGEKPKKSLTAGQKSAQTKKRMKKKIIAHKSISTFRKEKRTDEDLKEKMMSLVRKNTQVSTVLFKNKIHVSERRLDRLLEQLMKEGRIEDRATGDNVGRHRWMIPDKMKKNAKVNGHAAKSAKSKRIGGPLIDVTSEDTVNKAIQFLKTHDWVNKSIFIKGIDLSPVPGNRLIEYLKKKNIVKQVKKSNNPAHEKVKKIYVQHLPYLELA
jgi:hypothetical protein